MDKNKILTYIKEHPNCSSKQITDAFAGETSLATVKRVVNELVANYYVEVEGKARATRYRASTLFMPIDLDTYFSKDVDQREVFTGYNFDLIPQVLSRMNLFTPAELNLLNRLQEQFAHNYTSLSDNQKHREMERLGIDLSWKSSQIDRASSLKG